MPEQHAEIFPEIHLTAAELAKLQYGSIPGAMEDHWFLFFEDTQFYCIRSWSGNCIYIADVTDGGDILHALVNRDPAQYTCTNDEEDCLMLTHLVLSCAGRKEEADAALEQALAISCKPEGAEA